MDVEEACMSIRFSLGNIFENRDFTVVCILLGMYQYSTLIYRHLYILHMCFEPFIYLDK